MVKLDKKNCKILNLLQKNCRMSLTDIGKRVDLSVDSVKKRIEKMEGEVFYPKVQLRPRHFGFPNIVEVLVKLHGDKKEFIDYLRKHERVTELIELAGEWDFKIVIISKDYDDLGKITDEMRKKFDNIVDWSESLTTKVHKFEDYDMLNLWKGDLDEK